MLAYALVGLGAVLRLMPHLPNFTPIAAIALFGGVYLKRGHALLLPVAALFISDLFIGFDSWRGRTVVYGSFMLVGLIGLLIRKRKSLAIVVGGSLAGSLVFYLITNFAFLYPQTMYPHTLQGVMQSYINALPFFRYSLLGDLIYTGLLFGAYELILHIHKEKASASGDLYPLH
jgi:hypothetical protein